MSNARIRWAFILLAFALTIIAIYYPAPAGLAEQEASALYPASTARNLSVQASARPGAQSQDGIAHRPEWIGTDEDPFAARTWQPNAAPMAGPSVLQQNRVEAPEVAPLPVPLPYQFVGQMVDDGNQIVYLSRGDQVLLARKGETLEGSYKVLDISATQIEFEMLPSGLRQTLPIPLQDR